MRSDEGILGRISERTGRVLGGFDEYFPDDGLDALLIAYAWNRSKGLDFTSEELARILDTGVLTQVTKDGLNALMVGLWNNVDEGLRLTRKDLARLIAGSDLSQRTANGDTALLMALRHKRDSGLDLGGEEFEALVSGSDLDARDPDSGMTPLMLALSANRVDGLDLTRKAWSALIRGSNLKRKNEDGRDAAMMAFALNKEQGLGLTRDDVDGLLSGTDGSETDKAGNGALSILLSKEGFNGVPVDGATVSGMLAHADLGQGGGRLLRLLGARIGEGLDGVSIPRERMGDLARQVFADASVSGFEAAVKIGLDESGMDMLARGLGQASAGMPAGGADALTRSLIGAGSVFKDMTRQSFASLRGVLSAPALEELVVAFVTGNPGRGDLDPEFPEGSLPHSLVEGLAAAGDGTRALGLLKAMRPGSRQGLAMALEKGGFHAPAQALMFSDGLANGDFAGARDRAFSEPGLGVALNVTKLADSAVSRVVAAGDFELLLELSKSGVDASGAFGSGKGVEMLARALANGATDMALALLETGVRSGSANDTETVVSKATQAMSRQADDSLVAALFEAGFAPTPGMLAKMGKAQEGAVFDKVAVAAVKNANGKAQGADAKVLGAEVFGLCLRCGTQTRKGLMADLLASWDKDAVSGFANAALASDGRLDWSDIAELDVAKNEDFANLARMTVCRKGREDEFFGVMEKTHGIAVSEGLARRAVSEDSTRLAGEALAAGADLGVMCDEAVKASVSANVSMLLLSNGARPWQGASGQAAARGWDGDVSNGSRLPSVLALASLLGGESAAGAPKEITAVEMARMRSELLVYCPYSVVSNKDVVLAATASNPGDFAHGSASVRGDFAVALAACRMAAAERGNPDARLAVFKALPESLVSGLGLTEQNCVERLEEAQTPSFFNFKLKKTVERVRLDVGVATGLEDDVRFASERRMAKADVRAAETAGKAAALDQDEAKGLARVVDAAKGLVDGSGPEVSDADAAELKKLLERNVPALLDHYALVAKAERDVRSEDGRRSPREDLLAGLDAAGEILDEMGKRAVEFGKVSVSKETAVLERGLPMFKKAVESVDRALDAAKVAAHGQTAAPVKLEARRVARP